MNYIKDKKIIKIIGIIAYMIIFAVISITIGMKHEHWADEAQAWLIARDNNILEIFQAMHYEVTPAIWHILLKICIFLGLEYNNLSFLTTGLTLVEIFFLFKNKNIPVLFKILLPYTYFIFFQYTIVARSYSLIFPILMAIIYVYPKKEESLVKYGILLFLLMNVSLHGTLFAGCLWLEFFIQEFRKNKNIKDIPKKEKIFFAVIAIALFGAGCCALPASDCSLVIESSINVITAISSSMFSSTSNIIINIIGVILIIILIINLCEKGKTIKTLILIIPSILFIAIMLRSAWHCGLIFLFLFTIASINDSFGKKVVYIIFLISIIIQIYWGVVCSANDYKYEYSAGEAASEYLKEIGYEDKNICGVNFWSVQLNPYFEENIFDNYSKSYYNWQISEAKSVEASTILDEELKYDIYVIPMYYKYNYENGEEMKAYSTTMYLLKLIEKIEESGEYEKKFFDGTMYVKNVKYEDMSLYVFVKN